MNKYKKRIITAFKTTGFCAMDTRQEYEKYKDCLSLATACFFYQKYIEHKLNLRECNV